MKGKAKRAPPNPPPSAFILFLQEYVSQQSGNESVLDMQKAAAAKWVTMLEKDKQPYVDRAAPLQKAYYEAMVVYEGDGEDDEESEDDE